MSDHYCDVFISPRLNACSETNRRQLLDQFLNCFLVLWHPELLRLTVEKILTFTVKETCTLLTTLRDASVCTDTGSKTMRWTTAVVVVIVVVVVLAGCVLLLWKCRRRIKGEAKLHI